MDIGSKLNWLKFAPNIKEDNKWSIQSAWLYEYEMFELAHIFQMIDWEKQIVFVTGY